jgi:hypothetical protein
MTNCEHCGKALRLIGIERKNGKVIDNSNGKDWKERKYHKKCYKKVMDRKMLMWKLEERDPNYTGFRFFS